MTRVVGVTLGVIMSVVTGAIISVVNRLVRVSFWMWLCISKLTSFRARFGYAFESSIAY